jgi:hypothetical protein
MYSVEHVVPKSKGGTDELNNLALSCQECNNHKSDKTESADPRTGIMTLLFHPRRDEWKEHFVWQDGYTRISGITPCGRVTVEVLHLNRPNVVNWRGVMYRADLHPLEDLTN